MKYKSLIRIGLLLATGLFATITVHAGQGPQPSICTRACWSARAPTCGITQMSSLNRGIIHHTAGTGDYSFDLEGTKAKLRSIQNYHISLGWCDIAYHFLVDAAGNTFEGRSGSMSGLPRGTHDGNNTSSFGFNVMGYYHPPYNQNFTSASRSSLEAVIAWRMPSAWSPYGSGTYNGNTVGYLDGHYKVKSTACPGDGVIPSIPGIRDGVNARKAGSPPPAPKTWTGAYLPLAGFSADAPTIVSTGNGTLSMFIRGGDNAIWQAKWTGTAWQGWSPLGGFTESAPSACSRFTGGIDLVYRGSDNNIWMRNFNGTSWGAAYLPVPGFAVGAPTIVSTGNGALSIFIRGAANDVWQAKWTGSAWQGWFSLGGAATSDLSACSRFTGGIDLVYRGTDNNIWMRNFNGSAWGGAYLPVPGFAASAPTIVSTGNSGLSIFIVGGDSAVYQAKWTGSWLGWIYLGGAATSAPAACSRILDGVDLVHRGTDNNIWMRNYQ